jgi:hypothetical protein
MKSSLKNNKKYIFLSAFITFVGIALSLASQIFDDYAKESQSLSFFDQKSLWWLSSIIKFFIYMSFQINLFLLILNLMKLKDKKISENINFNAIVLSFSMAIIYFFFIFPRLLYEEFSFTKERTWKDILTIKWIRISWWILSTSIFHFFSPLFFFIACLKNEEIKKLDFKKNIFSIFWKRKTLFFPYAYFFFALMMRNFELENVNGSKVKAVWYFFLESNSYIEIIAYLIIFTLIVFIVSLFIIIVNNLIYYETKYQKEENVKSKSIKSKNLKKKKIKK